MTYAIRFVDPEGLTDPFFAGKYKDALGFAPTLQTALLFDERQVAQNVLENGYGMMRRYGTVVEVEAAAAA